MTNLETVSGRLVNIEFPDPGTICLDDIAWGLSRLPRFAGHTITAVPFNVAQHSVFVADEVERLLGQSEYQTMFGPNTHIELIMQALLHDAAEAYTGDWPSPIKQIANLRPIIKKIETELMSAIYVALEVAPPTADQAKLIHHADLIARKTEAYAFMPSRGSHWPDMPEVSLERLQQFSQPLPSLTAYRLFVDKFNQLSTQRNKYIKG